MITKAASEIATASTGERVVIACSDPASHYVLRPRHSALRDALGERTQIQPVIFHRYSRNLPLDPVPRCGPGLGGHHRGRRSCRAFPGSGEAGLLPRIRCSPRGHSEWTRQRLGQPDASRTRRRRRELGFVGGTGSRSPGALCPRHSSSASTTTSIRWRPPSRGRASHSAGGTSSIGILKTAPWSRSAMATSNATTTFAVLSLSKGASGPIARMCLSFLEQSAFLHEEGIESNAARCAALAVCPCETALPDCLQVYDVRCSVRRAHARSKASRPH